MRPIINLILIFLFVGAQVALAQGPNKRKTKKKSTPPPTIKTETCWQYNIVNNMPALDGVKTSETSYRENGKRSYWKRFDAKGNLKYAYEYNYNDKDQTLSHYIKNYNGSSIKDAIETFDEQGNLTSSIRYKPSGDLLDKVQYEYDGLNRLIFERRFDENNEKIYQISFMYNDFSNTITEEHEDFKNETGYKTAITLDYNDLPISIEKYEKSGPLINKVELWRDESGRITEKHVFGDGEQLSTLEKYDYDTSGTKMTHSIYLNGGKELVYYMVHKFQFYE